uniref:WD repeat-containing protein 70 n=1 Tax=Myotis myotis TaxID=51298 RepID=A0A7J7TTT9_MYOMY|nr:hypothetical protein mMyoMyo1_008988 [Myotis myotis]
MNMSAHSSLMKQPPIQSTAGAFPVRNEQGEILMEKVKRYVSGKRPDFAPMESSDEEDEEFQFIKKDKASVPARLCGLPLALQQAAAMEHRGPSEGAETSGSDPQLAVTMGFTGFGKKARTFDLEAMFEQTRTAVERSRKTLEAREKEEEMNREKELRRQNEDIEPTSSGSNVVRDCSKSSSSDTSSSGSEESSDSSDDELIGPPLPPTMAEEPVDRMEQTIGRLPPPLQEEDGDDDDGGGGDSEEENPVQKIPDSHEITLKHGTKTVSALGLDPSGARLVTGGYDYDVKFWDFAGMDASFKAF